MEWVPDIRDYWNCWSHPIFGQTLESRIIQNQICLEKRDIESEFHDFEQIFKIEGTLIIHSEVDKKY